MGASGFGLLGLLWFGVFRGHPLSVIYVPVPWAFLRWPHPYSLVHVLCAGTWLRIEGHWGGLRSSLSYIFEPPAKKGKSAWTRTCTRSKGMMAKIATNKVSWAPITPKVIDSWLKWTVLGAVVAQGLVTWSIMKTIGPWAAKTRKMTTKIKQKRTQMIRREHQFKSIIAW